MKRRSLFSLILSAPAMWFCRKVEKPVVLNLAALGDTGMQERARQTLKHLEKLRADSEFRINARRQMLRSMHGPDLT